MRSCYFIICRPLDYPSDWIKHQHNSKSHSLFLLIVSILYMLLYLGNHLILQVHVVLTSPPEVITSSSRACVKAGQSPLTPHWAQYIYT